jgi:hypothetical protein
MRAWTTAVVLALASVSAAEARQSATLRDALVAALRPALPFPEASDDGAPSGGDPGPVWTVRWPAEDSAVVEVLANPFNAENHARALKADAAIQKAAMQSQQRSQADYDKAVSDFQKTGRVSEIREISLRDDGPAGERYDAESQLTIDARVVDLPQRLTVGTGRLPEAFPGSPAAAAIIRVAANEYQEPVESGAPAATRFCPEQAWLLFGPIGAPAVSRTNQHEAAIAVTGAAGAGSGKAILISLRGNVELVDRVLQRANWALVTGQ